MSFLPDEYLPRQLECGCEVSGIDGTRLECCEDHVEFNPCFPYWPWHVQERVRKEKADREWYRRAFAL